MKHTGGPAMLALELISRKTTENDKNEKNEKNENHEEMKKKKKID